MQLLERSQTQYIEKAADGVHRTIPLDIGRSYYAETKYKEYKGYNDKAAKNNAIVQ